LPGTDGAARGWPAASTRRCRCLTPASPGCRWRSFIEPSDTMPRAAAAAAATIAVQAALVLTNLLGRGTNVCLSMRPIWAASSGPKLCGVLDPCPPRCRPGGHRTQLVIVRPTTPPFSRLSLGRATSPTILLAPPSVGPASSSGAADLDDIVATVGFSR